MTEPNSEHVKKVDGGYQLHAVNSKSGYSEPVNDKVYLHPTSAYAALGRIVHAQRTQVYDHDPAKAAKDVK